MRLTPLRATCPGSLPRLPVICRACACCALRWPEEAGWRLCPDLPTAVAQLPGGARVLTTTGRMEIADLARRRDLRIWLRSIDPVEDLPPHITPILARPPFPSKPSAV